MQMLEQVKRSRTTAIEKLNISLLGLEEIAGGEFVD